MTKRIFPSLFLGVALSMSTAALADDLTYIVDEKVNYTQNCEKGWYLLEQKEPIFSRGLPPYQAIAHFQFQEQGATSWTGKAKNLPTDFGAKTVKSLQDLDYLAGISADGQVKYSSAPIGYVVATKHVALEGNNRITCVYAELSEVDGYTLHESPVTGSYQRPKIKIRRFIGEVSTPRNVWSDFRLGSDNAVELSIKVDVAKL